ncbi:MAG: GDP-mannose 4,6-dehydratase [Candidatus Bathyarchaeota archaeon]|nr:GDP-mannose 4,6-dehydratase [Candidatus Bathyarchaeota archaeon]
MEELNSKKVMVTGGAGFIGYHLTKKLVTLTPNLTIYDDLSSGKMENVNDVPSAKFVKGDILDAKALLAQEKTDLIYHLAAQVVVPYSMENPLIDFDTNAKGTMHVLEKARKDDAKLVFASSAAVYGNPTVFPTPEGYGFHPFSCYGLSKVVGEEYCQMYQSQYGLDITIMRFANVFGPRCHGVIHDFIEKLEKNPDKLEIIGTGLQSRDFVHVSDVVDALIKVGESKKANGEVYNIGCGTTTSILELAKMIIKILGLKKTVITTTNVSWQGDVTKIWFNNNKAKRELKWNPKITLEDHIREIIAERKNSK